MEVLQLLIGGVAQGCVYGLIALGFVLIYKATEQVNFAQGDILMIGAYVALTLIVEARAMGWSIHLAFWLALPLTMAIMALFGYLLDRVALRPIIGQPAYAPTPSAPVASLRVSPNAPAVRDPSSRIVRVGVGIAAYSRQWRDTVGRNSRRRIAPASVGRRNALPFIAPYACYLMVARRVSSDRTRQQCGSKSAPSGQALSLWASSGAVNVFS